MFINLFFEIFGHGGGKIKRKSIALVLMLSALALTLSANTVFATENTSTSVSDQNNGQINQINDENLDKNTVKSSVQEKTTEQTKNMAAGSPTTTKQAAAGSTASTQKVTTTNTKKVTPQKSFTRSQINYAAIKVKAFKDRYKRLPSYITISSTKVTMPQFLKLMTVNLLNINSKHNKSVKFRTVKNPSSNLRETVKKGSITKKTYLSMAKNVNRYINKYGRAPGSISSSRGRLHFKNLVYTFAKLLRFYNIYGKLAKTTSVSKWSTSSRPKASKSKSEGSSSSNSALSKYLRVTTHAQSNNFTIKKLAASITRGKTSTYAKAKAIFNWVRGHVSYSFYYNTKKGAIGALKSRTANCVDNSHLMVALARAAKIPARYQHGTCRFSSGTYGHVWAQLYVNGKWYYADGVSVRNSFGTIKNWNLRTYRLHGTYASLPF